MDKSQIKSLQKQLKYKFRNKELLVLAMTHPSYVQGTEKANDHNQRLEFLGDAVLGMVVAEEVYLTYPTEREGFLTKARSSICHGKGLTQLARTLGIEEYLLMGKGEKKSRIQDRSLMLGDTLEAIIGAVYLDGGYRSARKLVLQWVNEQLQELVTAMPTINYKGTLQEWSQSRYGENRFVYEIAEVQGPDHARVFTIHLKWGERVLASASGSSKKDTEAAAARQVVVMIETHGGELPEDPAMAG
jgi:ribonuclease III